MRLTLNALKCTQPHIRPQTLECGFLSGLRNIRCDKSSQSHQSLESYVTFELNYRSDIEQEQAAAPVSPPTLAANCMRNLSSILSNPRALAASDTSTIRLDQGVGHQAGCNCFTGAHYSMSAAVPCSDICLGVSVSDANGVRPRSEPGSTPDSCGALLARR